MSAPTIAQEAAPTITKEAAPTITKETAPVIANHDESDDQLSAAINDIESACATLKQLISHRPDLTKGIAKTKVKKKQVKKKPEGHPKAPHTAYNFYCESRRTALKTDGHAPNSILKICGADWNTLSVTQRATFAELNEKDKERYAREKAAFDQLTAATGKATAAAP